MLSYRKRMTIKEAFDNLPSGICFFDRFGRIVLCNRQMYRIVFMLTNKDLQKHSELREMLENPKGAKNVDGKYILENGEAWKFSCYDVEDNLGNEYIQYIASDVTLINNNQEKLNESNRELEKMNEDLKDLLSKVNDIVREEETLAVKIRIHDELGHNMLAARRLLFENADVAKIKEGCVSWKATIDTLNHINHMSEVEMSKEDLEQYADKIGVTLSMEGRLPDDGAARGLYVAAIKECITNCVRHTESRRVYASVMKNRIVITNDGAPPESEIEASGGLLSLREKACEKGFSMTIASTPNFRLLLEKTD